MLAGVVEAEHRHRLIRRVTLKIAPQPSVPRRHCKRIVYPREMIQPDRLISCLCQLVRRGLRLLIPFQRASQVFGFYHVLVFFQPGYVSVTK